MIIGECPMPGAVTPRSWTRRSALPSAGGGVAGAQCIAISGRWGGRCAVHCHQRAVGWGGVVGASDTILDAWIQT